MSTDSTVQPGHLDMDSMHACVSTCDCSQVTGMLADSADHGRSFYCCTLAKDRQHDGSQSPEAPKSLCEGLLHDKVVWGRGHARAD